ncbi:MAG: hypothetical protein H5T97_01890 [Firmicutes bacterium]|nr:hypothetical protein [Bacillota bacterium]
MPFVETARFDRFEGSCPVFVARGGGDTAAYDFPYELVYDPGAKALARRPLWLLCDCRVEFGKGSWRQVLAGVGFDAEGAWFDFRPREGEVLAGGHWLPEAVSSYDAGAGELVLVFRDAEAGSGVGVERPLRSEEPGCPVGEVVLRLTGVGLETRLAVRAPALWRAEVLLLGGEQYSSTVRCRVLVRQAR